MPRKRKTIKYSNDEITAAIKELENYDCTKACSNNKAFPKTINANYSNEDYSFASIKRTFLNGCTIDNSDFTGSAVAGSKFLQASFINCIIKDAGFQSCDFIDSKFHNDSHCKNKYTNNNFSNSYFYNTIMENIIIYGSTLHNSLFEGCTFLDSEIKTSTLEGTSFINCHFTNVDMSNLNIDYTRFEKPHMHNVTLPFYQVPYIINGPVYLRDTADNIWIESEKAPLGKIALDEYISQWDNLCVLYYHLREYFPLANLQIAMGNEDFAFSCICEGLDRAVSKNDFRMVKHFCRLSTSTGIFDNQDIKTLLALIESRFKPDALSRYELHCYIQNMGEIRNILLNGNYSMQTLEILIKTNIDSGDSQRVGIFIDHLNEAIADFIGDSRSQYIELRHNSDYTVFINFVNTLHELLPLLVSIYSAFGVVDKVVKFYSTTLDIQQKKKAISNKQGQAEKTEKDPKIKALEAKIRQLTSENKRLKKSNDCLLESVTELTHYLKGTQESVPDTEVLYSKVTLNPQKDN